MGFENWMQELSKRVIQRSDETPRVLNWIYDAIDEDLDEDEESPGR